MKKGLLKKILGAIFKGVIKSVPFGNVAVELGEAILPSTAESVLMLSDDQKKQLANYYLVGKLVGIATQVVCLFIILHAYLNGNLPAIEAIELLNPKDSL